MIPHQVSIVCLPGSGGCALADTVRARVRPGLDRVKLVAVADSQLAIESVVASPFGVASWTDVSTDSARFDAILLARRLATQLSWLLWELEVDADVEVSTDEPLTVVIDELTSSEVHSVILAVPNVPHWRSLVTAATRAASETDRDFQVAVDSPPRVIDRWLARIEEISQPRHARSSQAGA